MKILISELENIISCHKESLAIFIEEEYAISSNIISYEQKEILYKLNDEYKDYHRNKIKEITELIIKYSN